MKTKKLTLNKKTIARLGGDAMRNANGGALPPQTKETECICLSATCDDSNNCNPPAYTVLICIKSQEPIHCFDNSDFCITANVDQCWTKEYTVCIC